MNMTCSRTVAGGWQLRSVEQGWKSMTCTCAYQDNSGRKEMRRRLEALTDGDESKKMHLFNALRNIRTDYLP